MCSCALQNIEEQFEGENWVRQEFAIIFWNMYTTWEIL